jgi:hypothetical protein
MAVFGGSATLYGVLYEVLGAVGHLVNFSSQSKGTLGGSIRIRFQPVGGGGDLRVEGQSARIVEQWKARPSERPWGPGEIAKKVLTDLLQDPSLDLPKDSTQYRFVTEGRVSGRTRERFEDLRRRLAGGCEVVSWPDESREFLRSLESAAIGLRSPESRAFIHDRTKLLRLLSRFSIRDNQTLVELGRLIDAKLGPRLEYLDDLNDKKALLFKLLVAKGASGEAEVNPSDLFREAGLVGIPLTDIDDLRVSALTRLKRRIENVGYERGADVRTCPNWPAEKPILLLGGDSGQGKSWQLARLALEMSSEAAVVYLPWGDHQESIPERVAHELWISAWKHDKPLALESLANRCQDVPLVACLDGVPSFAEAKRLLDAFDWVEHRVRLAFTGPSECRTLVEDSRQGGYYRPVEDFTVDELRRFLRARGRNWATVASDVLELLRRPLWARLFVEVGEEDWHPTQEYELFERYWRHLRELAELRDYPEDFRSLRQLGLALLDPESAYPWTLGHLEEAGIQSEARIRLEKVGFWSRNDDQLVAWHDRLISWIVAEAIASQPADDQVLALFQKCTLRRQQLVGRLRSVFGYVTLDLLWLVLGKDRASLAADLIATLERDASHYAVRTGIYEGSLLKLGPRVVPALRDRLTTAVSANDDDIAEAAARAIGRIAAVSAEGSPVRRVGLELLKSDDVTRQDLGVEVVSLCPDPEAVRRLWELLSLLATEPPEHSNRHRIFWQTRQVCGALGRCLELAPTRLLVEAGQLAPGDSRWKTVAELLAKLDNPDSQSVWRELKTSLLAEVNEETVDSLVWCIEWFRDREEVDCLAEWTLQYPGSEALWGLAWLDPDVALKCFEKQLIVESMRRAFWVLLDRRPGAARAAFRRHLLVSRPEFWKIASFFRWSEEALDSETLQILVARFSVDVKDLLERPGDLFRELGEGLQLFASINSPESLAVIRQFAGPDLSSCLAQLAQSWKEDRQLEVIWHVLLRIGGAGLEQVVLTGLASEANRELATGWAMVGPEFIGSLPQGLWAAVLAGADLILVRELLDGDFLPDSHGICQLQRLRRGRPAMGQEISAEVFKRLSEPTGEVLTRSLWVLLLTGRADWLGRLPAWLNSLEASLPKWNADLDRAARLCIRQLGSEQPEVISVLAEQLDLDRFPNTAVEVLNQPGGQVLAERLASHLADKARVGFSRLESLLVASLDKFSPVSTELLNAVRQQLGDPPWFDPSGLLGLLATGASPREVDEIVRLARTDDGFGDHREEALKALRLRSPEAAFDFACNNLRAGGRQRVQFLSLILEWDKNAAVEVLVDQAEREKETVVRWAIYRVLRRADQSQLRSVVKRRLRAPAYRVRESAAYLAGWQVPGFLKEELEDLKERDPSSPWQKPHRRLSL